MAGKLRFDNPNTLPTPPGYSYVVEATGPGRTIYFAGQLGVDMDNKFVGEPGDFSAQCVKAHDNMTLALAAAGATWSDVVKINNYLVDITPNMTAYREIRNRYLNPKAPPASTTVGVPALARPGGLFEVEAIAFIADKAAAKPAAKAKSVAKKSKKKKR
jgi:enamine deaminase RidA (YjgF/YER057c/UK114 family)